METQTWLSYHNKFISAENITILSVSSDDFLHAFLDVAEQQMWSWTLTGYIYIYIYILAAGYCLRKILINKTTIISKNDNIRMKLKVIAINQQK